MADLDAIRARAGEAVWRYNAATDDIKQLVSDRHDLLEMLEQQDARIAELTVAGVVHVEERENLEVELAEARCNFAVLLNDIGADLAINPDDMPCDRIAEAERQRIVDIIKVRMHKRTDRRLKIWVDMLLNAIQEETT